MIWNNLLTKHQTRHINKKHVALLLSLCIVARYGIINMRYFFNLGYIYSKQKLTKRKKIPMSGTIESHFRVTLTDIDYLLHMNNVAYLKYAECGLTYWALDTNLLHKLQKHNFSMVTSASTVRYRRQLLFNEKFTLGTRCIYWNEYFIIIKHSFINQKTKFVHAIVYVQIILTDGKTGKKYESIINSKKSNDTGGGDDGSNMDSYSEDNYKNKSKYKRVGLHCFDFYETIDDKWNDLYHCRNKIAKSLEFWIKTLENSKIEAKVESNELLKEKGNNILAYGGDDDVETEDNMIASLSKIIVGTTIVGVGCYVVYKLFNDDNNAINLIFQT